MEPQYIDKDELLEFDYQEKPAPIGIIPKFLWIELRFYEVCSVISRYYSEGKKIPIEWIKEYNELIDKIE